VFGAYDQFELWLRERARTQDYFVVHIATGRYLHIDGRLHDVRQYFGTPRYAAKAMMKFDVVGQIVAVLDREKA
jgi:hypothetical protein